MMRPVFRRTLLVGALVALLLAGLAAAPVAAPALAQGTAPPGLRHLGPGPGGPHPFGARALGPWVWVAGGLFALLRLALLVGLIVLVWRLLSGDRLWRRPDPAAQILRERYARGEIDEDEYRKRLATLT